VRNTLTKALTDGERGAAAANRLCAACLPLLGVDSAAISLIDDGVSRGTFGASDQNARTLDELQFTCGEGPCLEAARSKMPVLVPDLYAQNEPRWPAFKDAAQHVGIRAVFAIPVNVGNVGLGALDLFRVTPGPLSPTQTADALMAAEAASQILLDIAEEEVSNARRADPLDQWAQVPSLARVEVYQATGMVMAQLDVSPIIALLRLRAYAFAHRLTATDVATQIIDRTLRLQP
jgi:hypothetical protein